MPPSRCQYVSGLFLQCNNLLNSSAPSTSGKPGKDDRPVFCDKHSTFIETVKAHANVSKRALDPDFKIPPHLTPIEDPLEANKTTVPAHVFEPCCSDSWAFDQDNPLRNAGVLTEKEIAKQHDAALGRMLEKVQDLRTMLRVRFVEHLKSKPAILEEKKKLKLTGRNEIERAKLLRLKSDMSYAPYNRFTSVFLEKCRRKQTSESAGLRGQPNMSSWLEDEEYQKGENRCDFVHDEPTDSTSAFSFYRSPESDKPGAVLQAICDAVVEQEERSLDARRCKGRRIPMTDFCIDHVRLEWKSNLFVPCTACNVASLAIDGRLCRKHARRLHIKTPAESITLPNGPRILPPAQIDRQAPLRNPLTSMRPPTNGMWKMSSRQAPGTAILNGMTSPMVTNGPENRGNIPLIRAHPPITRKPRDPNRHLPEEERLPNEVFFVNQNASRPCGDGLMTYRIDEDLPVDKLEEACIKRQCLDQVAEIPLDKQPVATMPPQTLRVNGYSNGILTNSPLAVVPVPDSLSASLSFNQSSKAIRQNGAPSCARVRPFVSSNELKLHQSKTVLSKIQHAAPQSNSHSYLVPVSGQRMFRVAGNQRRGNYIRPHFTGPPAIFAVQNPQLTMRMTAAPGKARMVSDTRKTTSLH